MKRMIILLIVLVMTTCSEDESIIPINENFTVDIKVIHDEFQGIPLVIVGSSGRNLIISFESVIDGTQLTFTSVQSNLPNIMTDNEENIWDVFGYAIRGPRSGQRLKPTYSYMGYWFSFGAFFPRVEIYEGQPPNGDYVPKNPSPEWLIPTQDVFAGTGFDAIQALEKPEFIEYRARDFFEAGFYLDDDDLVLGVKINDEIKAYPHAILDWHEIANDVTSGQNIAVVYCPFTGTGSVWERNLNGELTTFGISGLLFNNNIMPYDRATASKWSQMKSQCVNGKLIGMEPEIIPFIETTWSTWQEMFDTPLVISDNLGFGRDYRIYPYGDYRTNDDQINFPLSFDDQRLPRKERVHGIIVNGKAKVYRFRSF